MEKNKNLLKRAILGALALVAFGSAHMSLTYDHAKANKTNQEKKPLIANAYEGQFQYFINNSYPINATGAKVNINFTSNNIDFNYIQVSEIYQEIVMYFYLVGSDVPKLVYSEASYGGWLDNAYKQLMVYNTNQNSTYLSSINYFQSDTAQYVKVDGWYTFDNSIQTFNFGSLKFTSGGHYFNAIEKDVNANNLYYTNYAYDGSIINRILVYNNGSWSNQNYRLIYINSSTITSMQYNYLNTFGDFQFTNITNYATIGDLILSYADIPIYTLSGLMSFEVFGIELFTAFGSLVLLLVLLRVVKLFI